MADGGGCSSPSDRAGGWDWFGGTGLRLPGNWLRSEVLCGVSLRFDGRSVIVTRAALDPGPEIARELARRGAGVVLQHDSQEERARLEELVGEIESGGGTALTVGQPLATADGGAAVVEAARRSFGRVDAVVHRLVGSPLRRGSEGSEAGAETLLADGEQQTDVVMEAFHVLHPAWRVMREADAGRLVVLWPEARHGIDPLDLSSTANHAVAGLGVLGLAGVLKLEGADQHLGVNVVAWTPERGPMVDRSLVSLVIYLTHADATVTGGLFAVGLDGDAERVFVGVTPGMFDAALAPGTVAANALEVCTARDFVVPEQAGGEMPLLKRHLV